MRNFVISCLKSVAGLFLLMVLLGCSVSLDDLRKDKKETIVIQALIKDFQPLAAQSLPGLSSQGVINPQLWTKTGQLVVGRITELNSELGVYAVELAAETSGESLQLRIPYNEDLLTIGIGVPTPNTPIYLGEFDMRWMTLAHRVLANTTRYHPIMQMSSVEVLTILGHIYNKHVFVRTDKENFVSSYNALRVLPDGSWEISREDFPESKLHPSRLAEAWEVNLFAAMEAEGIALPAAGDGANSVDTLLDKNLISAVSIQSQGLLENLLLPNQPKVETLSIHLPLKKSTAKITFLRDLSLEELELMSSIKLIRTDSQYNKSEFLLRQLDYEVLASNQISFTIPREGGQEHFEFRQELEDSLHASFYFSIQSI